jgi:hypothetical protein
MALWNYNLKFLNDSQRFILIYYDTNPLKKQPFVKVYYKYMQFVYNLLKKIKTNCRKFKQQRKAM